MDPSVFSSSHKLKISYDLPHRIFSSKVYPQRAPNGSSIIVYGHELGLRIIWRGGKSFKEKAVSKKEANVNGSNRGDVMVLDSDEEEPGQTSTPSLSDFELAEEEIDWDRRFEKIIRYIDVDLGCSARHISIPNISVKARDSAPGALPPILLSQIVVAVACSDRSICLVTLPLLPPSAGIDDKAYKAVQVIRLGGTNSHREVPSSIAITYSAGIEDSTADRTESKSRSTSRSRLGDERPRSSGSRQSDTSWAFYVASISQTAGGLLLTHQIPLSLDGSISVVPEDLQPLESTYLGFPCSSSKVVFNTSAYPARRHSTLLMYGANRDCLKLYHLPANEHLTPARERRGSAATTDSTGSNLRASRGDTRLKGRFLLTLHTDFLPQSTPGSPSRRKKILDVAWVASGQAILVVLEGGEWGVWDLEGVGPTSGSSNLLQGQKNPSGIQGGALTKFALSGRFSSTVEPLAKTKEAATSGAKILAPMTPHSRKVRSEGLFNGRRSSTQPQQTASQASRGHICVTEHTTNTAQSLIATETSLILVFDSELIHISSLQALWRAETSKKGTFDSVQSIRPTPILQVKLGNDRLINISDPPQLETYDSHTQSERAAQKTSNIIVALDRSLIFWDTPISDLDSTEVIPSRLELGLRPNNNHLPAPKISSDQLLLNKGELDLEGMSRIIDGMEQQNLVTNGHAEVQGKSVAFHLNDGNGDDEDMGMSMNSPTPKARTGFRRSARQAARGGRFKGVVV